MRILHINKYMHERDGVGRYMHDVMRLADEHGHATATLAMHHPNNASSVWEEFFVSNLETKNPGKGIGACKQLARTIWSYEAYKKTRAIINAFRPDVIHAHNLYTHLSPSVLSAAYRAKIPVVLTAHDYGYICANYGLFDGRKPLPGDVSFYDVVKSRCIKNSAIATAAVDAVVRIQKKFGMWTRGVTHILTASHAVKHALVKGGYRSERIRTISLPSGTYNYCEEKPQEFRERRIVFAGRFETYKGIDVVIELAKHMPDVAFVCVGHGEKEEELRHAAANIKNLSVSSTLPPKELWELMRTSAGVVVPSRWPEPFGLVALEALALGTPAMVSNRGGLPEIVEDGVSGFVASPDHVKAWEQAIKALVPKQDGVLHEAQLRRAEEAQKQAKRVGDPEGHWQQLEEVYREAIHQRNPL